MIHVFHRTWWKHNSRYPDGLEPCPGTKITLAVVNTEEVARAICKDWNDAHEPGRYSDKAEYERE